MTSKTAKEELTEFHIMEELERLSEVLKPLGDDIPEHLLLEKAQYNILKYVATCAVRDPERGDYFHKDNRKLIVDAGCMLNEVGGIDEMRSFFECWIGALVPRRYRREIDMFWDGIGGWRG